MLVFAWAVMIGLLIKKHYLVSAPVSLDSQYLHAYIESRDEWAGIYLMDKKIGYAHSEIKKTEGGYQISEDLFMDMTVMNVPQKMETRINAVTDNNLMLNAFNFRLRSGIISFIVYGYVEDHTLQLQINAGGSKQKQTIALKEIPVLSNTLKYYILKKGLSAGSTYTQTFFDPLTLRNRHIVIEVIAKEKITVQGESYNCYKIKESFKGVSLYAWVDHNGDTIKEQSPLGLVLIKESKEQAMQANWGEKPDVLAAAAVSVDRSFSKAGLSYLKTRLKNISTEGFHLQGGRQQLDKDILEITLEKITASDTYRIPFSGKGLDSYLQPTAFIQSDKKEIKVLADLIAGKKKDAQTIIKKFTRWIFLNIEKKPTLSIPNAIEVLKTKQGDCNEHAVLLTALCRAKGIPAKMCAGLVYLKGKFYYHAWVEVYLNKWISVDPTLNQFPSDVTHIKFIEGDLESQITILRLIGKLEIEILEYL